MPTYTETWEVKVPMNELTRELKRLHKVPEDAEPSHSSVEDGHLVVKFSRTKSFGVEDPRTMTTSATSEVLGTNSSGHPPRLCMCESSPPGVVSLEDPTLCGHCGGLLGPKTVKATRIRSGLESVTIMVGTAVEVIKQDVNFGLAGVVKSMKGHGKKTIVMVDFKREGEPAVPYWLEDLKLAGDMGEGGGN